LKLHGGYVDHTETFDDTWLLNPRNGNCAKICNHTIGPTPRHDHSLVTYANESSSNLGRVFLFGGYTGDGAEANSEHALCDLWELVTVEGPENWSWKLIGGMSNVPTEPSFHSQRQSIKWPRARANASLVTAHSLGCLILFGGYTVALNLLLDLPFSFLFL